MQTPVKQRQTKKLTYISDQISHLLPAFTPAGIVLPAVNLYVCRKTGNLSVYCESFFPPLPSVSHVAQPLAQHQNRCPRPFHQGF